MHDNKPEKNLGKLYFKDLIESPWIGHEALKGLESGHSNKLSCQYSRLKAKIHASAFWSGKKQPSIFKENMFFPLYFSG